MFHIFEITEWILLEFDTGESIIKIFGSYQSIVTTPSLEA
jgi:hypothetical protein